MQKSIEVSCINVCRRAYVILTCKWILSIRNLVMSNIYFSYGGGFDLPNSHVDISNVHNGFLGSGRLVNGKTS
jgi:hypothetical protein